MALFSHNFCGVTLRVARLCLSRLPCCGQFDAFARAFGEAVGAGEQAANSEQVVGGGLAGSVQRLQKVVYADAKAAEGMRSEKHFRSPMGAGAESGRIHREIENSFVDGAVGLGGEAAVQEAAGGEDDGFGGVGLGSPVGVGGDGGAAFVDLPGGGGAEDEPLNPSPFVARLISSAKSCFE